MTTSIVVDGLTFEFSDGWRASKYDDWSFYRNQFSKAQRGIKAVDLLAIDSSDEIWLIEVKDYRLHPRTRPEEIHDEVAKKVVDTLAALLPASINANDDEELEFAKRTLAAAKIHVVLHLEQPATLSRLRPTPVDPASVMQKLRKAVKPIGSAEVVSSTSSRLPWSVRRRP